GWVERIAFAGEMLVTGDSWGRLIGWRYAEESPEPVWSREDALDGWIRGLAASGDGRLIAAAGNDASVKLFVVADGSPAGEFCDHPDDVYSVALHPHGQAIVTGDLKGTLRHFDLTSKELVRRVESPLLYKVDRIQDCGGVRNLTFDSTGKRLLVGGMKNPGGGFAVGAPLVLVYDWETMTVEHELQHGDTSQGFAYDAAFHPDGFVIAASCAMPNTGKLWFWRLGEPQPFFVAPDLANGRSLALHPVNKRRLAVVQSVSPNGNGRPKGQAYVDGTAKIRLLDLA
ncbi:MAG TPA: hypothetical protein VGE52_15455, partial [Pirellulales bacterium]